MDLYTAVSRDISRLITSRYSTSFGLSSTLFPNTMKTHIYAIYGLVRIADEIVDTYRGHDAGEMLDELERDCSRAIRSGYSANPVVHAFALTARTFEFDHSTIQAFFDSMRMDLAPFENTRANYNRYIYGSAEAVGLMCLHIFVDGDTKEYEQLKTGAAALGSAYQKINFLRDLAADAKQLDRWYFPDSSYDTFDDATKRVITDDIEQDIRTATLALKQLPRSSRRAVSLSLAYYELLLEKLKNADAEYLKRTRVRVPNPTKLALYAKARLK